MERADSSGDRKGQRMAEAVQEVGENIRRSFRVAYEEIVPGSCGTEDVVWSRCLSRARVMMQVFQRQKGRKGRKTEMGKDIA